MPRVAGVDLPNKRIVIALTYIYGIGLSRSQDILKEVGIDESIRANDLSEQDLIKIRDVLKQYEIEGDLRRRIGLDIKRLIEVNCYRGIRHRRGLPCRGQRTKTNSRTRRSKKRVAVPGKKQPGKK
ncbi:MAG: 30S ribosomal protein S13 [Candidatus Caenarcaniphilales bacterium]|nr:30S ribosomal protein S13 [Candidatus Caenarcaniphilales bacterium]